MFVQHYAPNHMPATKGIVSVTAGLKRANLSQKVLDLIFKVTVRCETQIM